MAQQKGVAVSEVVKSGPSLAFVAYPEAISRLPFFNNLFGLIFFFALVIAGISSGISLVEAMASALIDKFSFSRRRTITVLCALGALGSMIFTTRSGLFWLDIVDHFLNHYGLVLAGLFECLIVGWVLKADVLREHINLVSDWKINRLWDFLIKYWTPGLLVVILFNQLREEFTHNYGGYSGSALLSIGVSWVLFTLLLAIIFSLFSWEKSKLEYKHKPEEDKLMV